MATGSAGYICEICNFEVSTKCDSLFCNGFCQKLYHNECVNVTSSEYKKIKSLDKKIKWFCGPCEVNLNKVTSRVYSIEDFLNLNSTVANLASIVNSVIGKTESLDQQVSGIFSEIKKLSNVNDCKQKVIQPLRLRKVKKHTVTADTNLSSTEGKNTSEEGNLLEEECNTDPEWECQQEQTSEIVNFASVVKSSRKETYKPIIGTKRPEQAKEDSLLKVVDRKISIFLSRLHPDVTKETVEQFLARANVDNFDCEKLKTRYETYCSFKITLTENFVSTVLDPSFWPVGTLVKRFVTPKKAEGSRPPYVPSRVFLPTK